jgi:hypothetical protein
MTAAGGQGKPRFGRFPRERPLSSLVSVSVLDAPAARRRAAGNAYLVILFAILHR